MGAAIGDGGRGDDHRLAALSAALDEANRTLDQVQAWGGVGFWTLDLGSLEPYWSTQVFEILGLEVDSLDAFLAGIHPDDRPLVDQVAARVREQPGPYRVVHRYLRDGELRTLTHHLQSVAGADGRPDRLLGVMSDTSQLSALQAQVDAAAAVRNVGLIASTLVHSFKNQLAVVAGHAQLAVDALDRGATPSRESLLAIQRAATKGTELTRHLLALGRPTTAVRDRVAAAPLLERVAELARPIVGAANRVTVHVQAGAAPVMADAHRLEQVLIDFVINAADALPPSGGRVRLEYRQVDVGDDDVRSGLAPGRYGAFSVADDGVGMDEETRRRATEPFFTTKAAERGSGVGLASAAAFADELGGRLEIHSSPGSGTEVELLLPLAAVPAARCGRAPVRVVVVAQDEHVGVATAQRLVEAGVQAVPAGSWDEVDRFVRTEPIDAVVVDIRPPPTHAVVGAVPVVEAPIGPSHAGDIIAALDDVLGPPVRSPSRRRIGEPTPDPVEAGAVTRREPV